MKLTLIDTSADGDLLANFCAGRAGQSKLGGIGLDTEDTGTSSGTTDVHHENLVLSQLGNLGLLAIGSLNTQQATKQEVVDLNLSVDGRQLATVTQNETDKTISTAKGRVDEGTDTDKTTGNSELERVLLGEERLDTGVNGAALDLAILVLGDKTGTDLNLVVKLDDTVQDGTTSNTTLQLINLRTGLVNIEGTNDLTKSSVG